MRHRVDKYIAERLRLLDWLDKTLVEKSGISKSQISKLKQGKVSRLTGEIFYRLYSAFGDSCRTAAGEIYPELDLELKTIIEPERNEFGAFMLQFEEVKNSIQQIAAKTDISENRMRAIYYRKGSPEAFELLLIERAIGKEPGELFENFYGKGPRPVVGV